MKNLFFFGLLAISACSSPPSAAEKAAPQAPIVKKLTEEEKDQAAISTKLKNGLDDPASYQSVSFKLDDPWTKADSASLSQMITSGEDAKPYKGPDAKMSAGHRYQHEYRAKNKFGALVLQEATCVVYPGQQVTIMPF